MSETGKRDRTIVDIVDRLRRVGACRRCHCRSCTPSMIENHSHGCTHGSDCVETQDKLNNALWGFSILASQAKDEILALRTENARLTARVDRLESIEHG